MEENVKKQYVVYALWRPKVEEVEWKGEKREFINFYGVGFLNSIKNEKKIIAVYDEWRDANIVKTRLEAIKRDEYYKYLKNENFIRFVKEHPQMSLADLIDNYNANPEIPMPEEMQKKIDDYKQTIEERNTELYGNKETT